MVFIQNKSHNPAVESYWKEVVSAANIGVFKTIRHNIGEFDGNRVVSSMIVYNRRYSGRTVINL